MKILLVSHSSRAFFEARCQINQLNQRFEKNRDVSSTFDINQLGSVDKSVPFTGALTIWVFNEDNSKLEFLNIYDPEFKVQSACIVSDKIVVLGTDRIQILSFELELLSEVFEDFIVGGHTISPFGKDKVLFTSAPANKVFVYNIATKTLFETISLPEPFDKPLIGKHELSLKEHYVPTDLQPTHLNGAFKGPGGLLVTLWIQGAVLLREKDKWHEVVSGFRGCHGGRWVGRNQIMLTDSATGLIWYFDSNTGKVNRRVQVESRWLHDAEIVSSGFIVALLGDKNEIQLICEKTGDVLDTINCSQFGKTVMFVNCFEVDESLMLKIPDYNTHQQPKRMGHESYEPNLLSGFLEKGGLQPIYESASIEIAVASKKPVRHEMLMAGSGLLLEAGEYSLSANVICHKGGVSIGVLDVESGGWISQVICDAVNRMSSANFCLDKVTKVQLMVSAHNPNGEESVKATLREIGLRLKREDSVNLIPGFLDQNFLTLTDKNLSHKLRLYSANPLACEYLVESQEIILEPGKYLFRFDINCIEGALSAGIAISGGSWLCQLNFDASVSEASEEIEIIEKSAVQVVIAANNPLVRNVIDADVEHAGLYQIQS